LILADTSALVALLDAGDAHHSAFLDLFEETSARWVLPWAVLPEIDYLASRWIGEKSAAAFRRDLSSGSLTVEWGREEDLVRAEALCRKHRALRLGLVDSVVLAMAERTKAEAIATLDYRHFGAVRLAHRLRLLPRDA
jgi:predicted nucleic acid-binding protein